MPQPESENLSVKLFKNHKQALETSGLVPYLPSSLEQLEQSGRTWYRELRRPQWIWQGVDAIELESILARIANSQKHRSRDEWLDTVSGYHSGNWAYEWIHAGMEHQKKRLRNWMVMRQQKRILKLVCILVWQVILI